MTPCDHTLEPCPGCIERGARQELERLRAAVAEDDEASMCREELHTHGHGWCNGRAFVAILADPTP